MIATIVPMHCMDMLLQYGNVNRTNMSNSGRKTDGSSTLRSSTVCRTPGAGVELPARVPYRRQLSRSVWTVQRGFSCIASILIDSLQQVEGKEGGVRTKATNVVGFH